MPKKNGEFHSEEMVRALLAAIVASSDDAIISKTLDGTITSWNRAAVQMYGYTPEEAIGSPISIIIPPGRAQEEADILARLGRGEKIDHFETERIRKDGRLVAVSLTISPIRDSRGNVVGASKIARDITERKRAEQALEAEQSRLQSTLASIGDGVIVTDADGNVDFINPVAESLTGWSQADARGKPLEMVFDIINEASRRRVENPAARALREGVIVGLANHTVLRARDGTERAIDDSAAPIRDARGTIHGVVLVVRDVTAQRAAENFHAHLAAIVEGSDDAIISKNLDGIITTWNPGAERIFGWTAEEAIGRPITIVLPPERLAEETNILNEVRAGHRVDHFETVRMTKQRERVNVSLTISRIRNAEGEVIGASKIARDITEKKRSEVALTETARQLAEAQATLQRHAEQLEKTVHDRTAELRDSIADLEVFSSSMSHDLRAPLRVMMSFAQMLEDEYADRLDGEGRTWVRRIIHSGERLHRLIEDIQNYTSVTRSTVKLEPVSIREVVDRVLEDYPHITGARGSITIKEPLHEVLASAPMLAQSLANLIGNALKFSRPSVPPQVVVRSDRANGSVRIWVEDNGIGIPESEHERIFQLFGRGGHRADIEGNGVGLAVVQRAATRMNGTTGVESQPGEGSRFWIELPAARAAGEA